MEENNWKITLDKEVSVEGGNKPQCGFLLCVSLGLETLALGVERLPSAHGTVATSVILH